MDCLTLLFALLLFLLGEPATGSAPQGEIPPRTVVNVQAVAGLRFDKVRFAVSPGATVEIRFENADDMPHNLLITAPGARLAVVEAALNMGAGGVARDYTPDTPDVLWSLPVQEPGATASMTFTAPEEEGVYPYVCSVPGHGYVMYGAMYVTTETLPPLADDMNIPPQTAAAGEAVHAAHPYPLEPPMLYRTFMPDASPAAVAVWLTDELSFCWDAGRCMLRYAWRGGFVDNREHWAGKGQKMSQVVGQVFYRSAADFPLRIGSPDHIPEVRFLGYRMVEDIPTFHYRIDGVDVHERITARPEEDGLIRAFEVGDVRGPLWFVTDPADGVVYEASAGTWAGGLLQLDPLQARKFDIHMIDQPDALP